MQNLEDLKEKIFFEAKNIIDSISKISTPDELLLKKDLIEELNERVSFLKVFDKNREVFEAHEQAQNIDNEFCGDVKTANEDAVHDEEHVEEEVLFTNELNEIHKDENEEEHVHAVAEHIDNNEHLVPPNEEKKVEVVLDLPKHEYSELEIDDFDSGSTSIEEEMISQIQEENLDHKKEEVKGENIFLDEYHHNVEEKEKEFEALEENRRKIVEFEKETPQSTTEESSEQYNQDKLSEIQEKHREDAKKFKLSNIKGLKSVQSLFDDDPLEKLQERETHIPKSAEETDNSGSLLKTNMPTNFMEAEKTKQEFRLDLNDKLSFTKMLFGGSQSELNEAIRHLNEFKDLEEAKQYLSDLYYERNWKKADDYAQRLWTLVENKFL